MISPSPRRRLLLFLAGGTGLQIGAFAEGNLLWTGAMIPMGAGYAEIGLAHLVTMLLMLLFTLPLGVLVDRVRRGTALAVTGGLAAGLLGSLASAGLESLGLRTSSAASTLSPGALDPSTVATPTRTATASAAPSPTLALPAPVLGAVDDPPAPAAAKVAASGKARWSRSPAGEAAPRAGGRSSPSAVASASALLLSPSATTSTRLESSGTSA